MRSFTSWLSSSGDFFAGEGGVDCAGVDCAGSAESGCAGAATGGSCDLGCGGGSTSIAGDGGSNSMRGAMGEIGSVGEDESDCVSAASDDSNADCPSPSASCVSVSSVKGEEVNDEMEGL